MRAGCPLWTKLYRSAARLILLPSREEAWSQRAVLSLAEGVPVIGTAVDGLSDTLSHGCGVRVATEGPLALSEAVRDVLAGRAPIDPGGCRRLRPPIQRCWPRRLPPRPQPADRGRPRSKVMPLPRLELPPESIALYSPVRLSLRPGQRVRIAPPTSVRTCGSGYPRTVHTSPARSRHARDPGTAGRAARSTARSQPTRSARPVRLSLASRGPRP
jgi:hypothetical protein